MDRSSHLNHSELHCQASRHLKPHALVGKKFRVAASKITKLILRSFVAAQSKGDKDKEEFECPPNAGNGNFADPVSCRRFYQVRFII